MNSRGKAIDLLPASFCHRCEACEAVAHTLPGLCNVRSSSNFMLHNPATKFVHPSRLQKDCSRKRSPDQLYQVLPTYSSDYTHLLASKCI
eukprot:6129181-Amphidinium_carterae.3